MWPFFNTGSMKKGGLQFIKNVSEIKKIINRRLKRYGIENSVGEIIPEFEITAENNLKFEYDEFD